MSEPLRLLITGSRRATPEMFSYAYRAVARAKALGWRIIVGDADGVDFAVMDACNQLGVPYVCYGIDDTPRHGNPPEYVRCEGGYLDRDRMMAKQCDRVLAIWNGVSTKSGTCATYRYAINYGKPGDLISFARPARSEAAR